MAEEIRRFERRLRSALSCLAFALCGCAGTALHAQPQEGALAITEISLERDCFGCPTGSVVTLRRDGSATLTTTGKARHGTQDVVFEGKVSGTDFDELARLAVSSGFFNLGDTYEDPQTRDGSWTVTRVVRGKEDKRVFRRGDAGPPTLRVIETAINASVARITFLPTRQ